MKPRVMVLESSHSPALGGRIEMNLS